jgi:hypothetical protein
MGKNNKKVTFQVFYQRAIKSHGNKYIYNIDSYKNYSTPLLIYCNEHKVWFKQYPKRHINKVCGCPSEKRKVRNTHQFIDTVNKIHNFKYDYSITKFIKSHSYINIICHRLDINGKEHGEFRQTAKNHYKHGCPKCATEDITNQIKFNNEEFIIRARLIHGSKYDYSKVNYINAHNKVVIICHKLHKNGKEHGEFRQDAGAHLHGHGCSKCHESLGESLIRCFLLDNNIKFIKEKTFYDLIGDGNGRVRLDFYLPEYNTVIEFDGKQHFEISKMICGINIPDPVDFFNKIQLSDSIKNQYCIDNGIDLIRIPYWDIKKISNILTEKLLLKKAA